MIETSTAVVPIELLRRLNHHLCDFAYSVEDDVGQSEDLAREIKEILINYRSKESKS